MAVTRVILAGLNVVASVGANTLWASTIAKRRRVESDARSIPDGEWPWLERPR